MSDPFFNSENEKKKQEEKKPSTLQKPSIPTQSSQRLPEIKVNVSSAKPEALKPDTCVETKSKTIISARYTNRQQTSAMVLYISIVVSLLITIGGAALVIAELFMPHGKFKAFAQLSLGYQIAITGAMLAALFFLVIFFYALSKRGVKVITKIIFKPRDLEEKYKNKFIVKIIVGALMISIFAIIIGIIISILLEFIVGSEGIVTLAGIFGAFDTTGQFVLFLGIFILIINGLAFALNYLWYNGYYLILKMIGGLEAEE